MPSIHLDLRAYVAQVRLLDISWNRMNAINVQVSASDATQTAMNRTLELPEHRVVSEDQY